MKEIWKKSSLFYKIIAVMLTVVMVGTSLYFHFDRKYSAKAAAGDVVITKAYLPSGKADTTIGDEGWHEISDGAVGNETGREFAYLIKVKNNVTFEDSPYYKIASEDGITHQIAGVAVQFNYGEYKVYVVPVPNFNYDTASANQYSFYYTLHGESMSSVTFEAFSWVTDTNLHMTANIGEDDFHDGNFNPLASNASLNVNITSGSELTGFAFLGEDKLSAILAANPNAKNEQTGLYSYTYPFTFSSLGDVVKDYSTVTNGLKITAADGTNTITYTAGSLKYDGKAPKITLTKVGDDAYDSTKEWYSNDAANITIAITSGSDDAAESDLDTVTVNGTPESSVSGNNINITPSVVEGENTFDIAVTDKAGNSETKNITVKLDNTTPKVATLSVGGNDTDNQFIGLNNEGDIVISGTTSDACANGADGSGVSKVNIEIKRQDNTSVASKIFDVQTDGSYSVNITAFDEIDSTALASGTYDGSYKVIVTATDNVNKTSTASDSKELAFTLDSTKPSITAKLERHATGAADDEWEQVLDTDVDTASNTLFVNGVTYDKLRYKIEVTEANPADTEPVTIKKTDDSSASVGALTNDLGIYYYTISSSDLSTAEALSLKAVVKDKSNNENVSDNQLLLPKLQLVDADIKVELLEVWCDGEKIADATSLTDLKTDFNSQYTIKVIAKSGFAITELELRKGDETPAYASIPAADIGDSVDSMGIHTTSSNEFTLPSGTENEAFGSLKIYVKNSNNDTKEVPIGDLLYDHTDPFVKIVDKATGTSVDYTKWYQDITVGYEIKSGSSAVEANLDSVKYTVDGQENILTPSGITLTGDIAVSESTSTTGTNVTFDVKDKATNSMPASAGIFNIKVDKTAPQVSTINLNGEAVTESTVLAGTPSVTSKVTDNLTINNYVIAVKYNGEDYASSNVIVNKDGSEQNILYNLDQIINGKEIKDGKYTISIVASDKSGRTSNVSSTSFVIDNTAPVVTASILSGTSGKNNGYYSTDVVVRLTCADNNFSPEAMTVTDNGSAVAVSWQTGMDMYYTDLTISAEGLHDIRVSGNDKAGTPAEAKQVSFVIDKTAPTVALLMNGGQVYNESRGTLNLTGPLTLTASVTDTNEDANDLRIQVIKTVPDTATTTSEYAPTGTRTFTFSDEADYTINIFAVDKANNQGATRTISFRVDTTAPQLTISGANGGTSASATSVSFNINEAFWSDAKGSVEIYRKAGDGVDETLYKTLTLSPTQRSYSLSELLNESGVYRFEFTAEDKVGHTATTSQKLTVDKNKPEITLTGVKNYDSTDGAVSIAATIADEFYANKKVNISGTRIDANGKKTALSFSPYAATANPTTINDTFTEEGIYDITISATDIAGNVSSNSVHFTIDTSAPIIGDLSEYDGKTFNKIDLDIDLDELVSDLTVCDVRMYLNGSEYDGISDIDDGSYTLLITAEDELGHSSEKSVTFILDTKEPIFIVTGVEDGEIRNDTYSIEVSLQLDEDTLDAVKLNDKDITIKNNVASINVTDKGEYELYMKAYDEAGNEAEQTITFTFGEESVATVVTNAVEKAASHWWMWAIVVAAIFAVGGFIFFILKRKKDNE